MDCAEWEVGFGFGGVVGFLRVLVRVVLLAEEAVGLFDVPF